MKHRVVAAAMIAVSLVAYADSAVAVPLTSAQRLCSRAIMQGARRYVYDVGLLLRDSIYFNTSPANRYCATARRCIGGSSHGMSCDVNADCPSGRCYPNLFSGTGIARRLLQRQNLFKTYVFNNCTDAGVLPADLSYPSLLCRNPVPSAPPMDFDQVTDCILRNNASYREGGVVVDTTFEPYRRASTHLAVPHPPDHTSYPSTICGVPGSSLLQIGTTSAESWAGREGGTRLLFADGCAGDVCQTKGESLADFAGNLLDDPIQAYTGSVPVCILMTAGDAGNGTFEMGSVNLTSGEQQSFQTLSATLLIGTTCPKCITSTGLCDSGDRVDQPCLRRGSEDIACPPTIAGSPPVITIPLALSTGVQTLNVPSNNPAGGVTNPAGTFCGACDLAVSNPCQNDQDCIDKGFCSGGLGSGCCVFENNTGYAGEPCGAPPTTSSVEGAPGPFVPHLAGLFCTGKSGDGLVDSIAGLPGPVRYVEPRLNVYAW
jgi:hypothetical protein